MISAILGFVFGFAALSIALDFGETENSDKDDDVDDDSQTDRNLLEAPVPGGSLSATAEDDVFQVDGFDARTDGIAESQGVIYDFNQESDVIAVRVPVQQDSEEGYLSSIRVEERSNSGDSLVHFNFSMPESSLDAEYVAELEGVSGLDGKNFGLMGAASGAGSESGLPPGGLLIGEDALEQYGVEIIYDYTNVGTDGADNITCSVRTDTISPNEHEVHEYLGFDEEDLISIALPPGFSGDIIQVPAREIAINDSDAATFSEQYIIVRPGYLEEVSGAILEEGFDTATAVSMKGVYAVIIITSVPIPEVTVPVYNEYGQVVGENAYHPFWNYWPKVDLTEAIDRVLI